MEALNRSWYRRQLQAIALGLYWPVLTGFFDDLELPPSYDSCEWQTLPYGK